MWSACRWRLRGQTDMRGLGTAGRCVRLEVTAGLAMTGVASFRVAHRCIAGLLHALQGTTVQLVVPGGYLVFAALDEAGKCLSKSGAGRMCAGGQGPAPAGEFAGDGDVGDDRAFAAFEVAEPAFVQAPVPGMSPGSCFGGGFFPA